MRFEQHVYGRVTSGFGTGRPGYGIAAISDGLLEQHHLLNELNRLSFCYPWAADPPLARYSMFQPAPGWLAFGCARMAKDRSGAVGSFAHTIVCRESDFVCDRASPNDILGKFAFFGAEADLPADRRLPVVSLEPGITEPSHSEWRAAALDLIDVFLGESALVVPLVVLESERTWNLLGEIFRLLPRHEAAKLSFSTLFVDATGFLDAYRLVFVPEGKAVPREESQYRVVRLDEHADARASTRPVPFTTFWRERPANGSALCRWIDRARIGVEDQATAALVEELLRAGPPFRAAAESLAPAEIYRAVVRRSAWVDAFGRIGGPLSRELTRAAVWAEPRHTVRAALEGLAPLGEDQLVADILEDVGRSVIAQSADRQVLNDVVSSGQLAHFFETVADRRRLADDDLTTLADRLSREAFYDKQLHRAVAYRVLKDILENNRRRQTELWVRNRASEAGDAVVRVVAGLLEWLDPANRRSVDYRLRTFPSVPADCYGLLLRVLWAAAPTATAFVVSAFRDDARPQLFGFCTSMLPTLTLREQQDLLECVSDGCHPTETENSAILKAILASPDAYELAVHYAACLARLPNPDTAAIARLRAVVRPPSRLKFWRW